MGAHFDDPDQAVLAGALAMSMHTFLRENFTQPTEVDTLQDSAGNYRPYVVLRLASGKRMRIHIEVLADGEPEDPDEADVIASLTGR